MCFFNMLQITTWDWRLYFPSKSRLGGVMISMIATGPKVCDSNLAEEMDF
jgi:hypothetical protein